jgi:hypothetical protein
MPGLTKDKDALSGKLDKLNSSLNKYTGQLEELKLKQATSDMRTGVSMIGGSAINYSLLKTESMFADIQADQLELQAQEQANMLRDNFNYAMGTEISSTAARGVKVGEGSSAAGMETSAKNLGKDVAKLKKSAKLKANTVRAQSKINKQSAKYGLLSGITQGGIKAYSGYTQT